MGKSKPVDELLFDGDGHGDTDLAVNHLGGGLVQLCIVDPARGDGPAFTLSGEQRIVLSDYLRTLEPPTGKKAKR